PRGLESQRGKRPTIRQLALGAIARSWQPREYLAGPPQPQATLRARRCWALVGSQHRPAADQSPVGSAARAVGGTPQGPRAVLLPSSAAGSRRRQGRAALALC